MAKKWLDVDKVIAITAMVTSVVAVFIAWDQSRLTRQSQRATFMPIMEIDKSLNSAYDQMSISLTVRNSGHGVGVVKAANLLHSDQQVENFSDLVADILPVELAEKAHFSWDTVEGYYAPGEHKPIIRFNWDETPENRTLFEAYLNSDAAIRADQLSLEICYCSVFDQCWSRADTTRTLAARVKKCAAETSLTDLWINYSAKSRPQEAVDE